MSLFTAVQVSTMAQLGSLDSVPKKNLKGLGLVEVGSSAYMAKSEDEDYQVAVSEEELEVIKKLAGAEEVRDGVVRIATEGREVFFYVKGDVVSEVVEANVAVICSWPTELLEQFIEERNQMGSGKERKRQKAEQAVRYGLNPLPWQIS
jgi:hypothetical protein